MAGCKRRGKAGLPHSLLGRVKGRAGKGRAGKGREGKGNSLYINLSQGYEGRDRSVSYLRYR
jgi:hypothetical protein